MLCFIAQEAISREGNCNKVKTWFIPMRSLYPTLDHIGSDSSRSLFYFKVNLKQSSCLSDEELDRENSALPLLRKTQFMAVELLPASSSRGQ